MAEPNYVLRPAKAVQRRMVVDACRRLTAVGPLDQFQYVGFGGLEYVDIEMVHRALGVRKMVSIEKTVGQQPRFEFNIPFAGVQLLMGESNDQLANIDWFPLSIVWLDYTVKLTPSVLRDVEYVVRSACPGSLLLVSINAEPENPGSERGEKLTEQLKDYAPAGYDSSSLSGSWGWAAAQRAVLQNVATRASREARGGGFRQLFNFNYADNAKMQTWGGAITAPNVERVLDDCRFGDLDFIRQGDEPFKVKVPILTQREVRYLETKLPASSGKPGCRRPCRCRWSDASERCRVRRSADVRAGRR